MQGLALQRIQGMQLAGNDNAEAVESKAYRGSLPTHNILVGHKVHAIPGGSHHSHIGNGVESYLLIQRDRPLHPHNGLVATAGKLLVDAVHEMQHKSVQLGDVLAAQPA